MIDARTLRIGNYIGCKVSNDHGMYRVQNIMGWENDKGEWQRSVYIDRCTLNPDGAPYPETKLRGFKLTQGWIQEQFKGQRFALNRDPKYQALLLEIDLPIGNAKGLIRLWQISKESYCLMLRENAGSQPFETNPFKFVHELQNLYFSLTGIELIPTIKYE